MNQYLDFRVWVGGKVVGYVEKTDFCDTDGADDTSDTDDDEDWWYAGWMQFGTFTPVDVCGAETDVWPYATGAGGVIRSVPERPLTKR